MTKEALYDLACKRYEDPAVFVFGTRHFLGYWTPVEEGKHYVLTCGKKAVTIVAEGASWEEVALAAGLGPRSEPATLVSGTLSEEQRKELEG